MDSDSDSGSDDILLQANSVEQANLFTVERLNLTAFVNFVVMIKSTNAAISFRWYGSLGGWDTTTSRVSLVSFFDCVEKVSLLKLHLIMILWVVLVSEVV